VREPREFDIFPVAAPLFLAGLPDQRTQFLLGVVPLLLDALQLRCKVLRGFSSHSRLPYHSMAGFARQCGCRRCAMGGTDAGTPP
jgi:hypothetical protein